MDESFEKLLRARKELTEAEKDVDSALSAIRQAPRAEKTGITRAVEDAFVKVRAARVALDELEKALVAERK